MNSIVIVAAQALQEEFEAGKAEMVAAHSRSRKEAIETIAAMEREHAESAADARQVTATSYEAHKSLQMLVVIHISHRYHKSCRVIARVSTAYDTC